MPGMVQLSEAASIAFHSMVFLARPGEGQRSTHEVALATGFSEAHLAKVFQRLSRVGLVTSTRGPHGGFSLAKPPEEISFLEIYEAIEGPLHRTGCLLGKEACPFDRCLFSGLLERLTAEAVEFLEKTTLADFWKQKETVFSAFSPRMGTHSVKP